MKNQPIRGMKDIYSDEMRKYISIIDAAVKVGQKYGYDLIETPIVEYTDVFTRAIGTETDVVSKEMYTFSDRNGESITLRPEGTAGVVRAIISNNIINLRPVKYMYYGPMFRYDRPQKGRYRQFHQIGFENIGFSSEYEDAMTIAMAVEILNCVGIFDIKVHVNSIGDEETRSIYTSKIIDYFTKYENELSEDSKRRLKTNPMRILDSKDRGDQKIAQDAPKLSDSLTNEAKAYFNKVCELLEYYKIKFIIDQFLVRGLDYYCHTAFEIKTDDKSIGSVCGGGRYDKLVQMLGGPSVSGIGFAYGAERIMSMMENCSIKQNKIAVVPVSDDENMEAFSLLTKLHDANICAEFFNDGNIKKRMKMADKFNCSIAFIIGEDEIKTNKIKVKFMNDTNENNEILIDKDYAIRFALHLISQKI